ncbi:butyrophilin subfamily 3 member A2-like [Channa argus]|uniref:butyrophilin subfamily 3 member A2-like n=1 Tax=Channa argus TaxID=215402 RepID=UPI00351FBDBC
MLSLNYKDSLKHLLISFSALLLLQSVILLQLTDSCTGQSQDTEPSQLITALEGEDVILPCRLEPATNVVSKSLEWERLDLEHGINRFVHVWHEGQNLEVNQNPSYRGRTSLSLEKLEHGDLSLSLSDVKHSDNGRYRCYFPSQGKASTVELLVGSVSSPEITANNTDSGGVVLKCKSEGWYPKPEVLWLDGEGNVLPAGPTKTVRGPDDLYTVSRRVTVDKGHGKRFTCRVQQNNINQTRETRIKVKGIISEEEQFYEDLQEAVYLFVTFVVGGLSGFIGCLIIAFIAWTYIKITLTQRTQEELDALAAVLTFLKNLKKGLKIHRGELRQQLEETEKMEEENKRKLQLLEQEIAQSEKEKATDKKEGYFREKQHLLNAQFHLEKSKDYVEKGQLNVDILMQKTEGEITRIKDTKRRLEKHMKMLNLQVKESESQSDAAHPHRD